MQQQLEPQIDKLISDANAGRSLTQYLPQGMYSYVENPDHLKQYMQSFQNNMPGMQQAPFMEPWAQQQNQFSQTGQLGSFLTIERGNLLGIMLGAIFSSTVGGLIGSFINLGQITTVLAGIILKHFLKTGFGRDFANGVLIGGMISLFSGFGASVGTGIQGIFGEPRTGQGGVSGEPVTSPGRRSIG